MVGLGRVELPTRRLGKQRACEGFSPRAIRKNFVSVQKFFRELRDQTIRKHLNARQLPETLVRPFSLVHVVE